VSKEVFLDNRLIEDSIEKFELLLFSTAPSVIRRANKAGIGGFIVDWENRGKEERQNGADTQINYDTVDDLARVRAATEGRVICRINATGPATAMEADIAIEYGADEILLPMVESVAEVESLLRHVDGQCGLGILIETTAALGITRELANLPLKRVYAGLNDLAIQRGTPNIFEALADGTIDRIRERFTVPFGVAGLTLPDRGVPIPCRLLIAELIRLQCSFSFLRRSFHRDMQNRDMQVEIPRIHAAIDEARTRSPREIFVDREEFVLAAMDLSATLQ
jgi:hypothetical protein